MTLSGIYLFWESKKPAGRCIIEVLLQIRCFSWSCYEDCSYPVYPERVDEAVQMTEGVVESCSVVIEKAEGPVLVTAVVPQEEYFYDNSLMEALRDRIKSECEMTLHESMRPSEIIFFVSLPRDTKGAMDYEAIRMKIELIQDEEPADDVISEPEPS